jgi:hypothetical protein
MQIATTASETPSRVRCIRYAAGVRVSMTM